MQYRVWWKSNSRFLEDIAKGYSTNLNFSKTGIIRTYLKKIVPKAHFDSVCCSSIIKTEQVFESAIVGHFILLLESYLPVVKIMISDKR